MRKNRLRTDGTPSVYIRFLHFGKRMHNKRNRYIFPVRVLLRYINGPKRLVSSRGDSHKKSFV